MLIIGCDFHPGFQQVAIFDNLTGGSQILSTRAKWRHSPRPRRSVATERLTGHTVVGDVVRDRMTNLDLTV